MKPYNDLTEKEATEIRLNYPPKSRILLEHILNCSGYFLDVQNYGVHNLIYYKRGIAEHG